MQRNSIAVSGAIAGLAAFGAGVLLAKNRTSHGNRDSAPGRTARHGSFGKYAVVGKTVTLSKPPRDQLFAFWRDFTNLPTFMDNLENVERLDGKRSCWTIKAPGGTKIILETEIVEEREGELIAWRSVEGSDITAQGRVAFRDAAGGRGTEVELIIAYKPPLGRVGQAIAQFLQREPEVQSRRDLRRFKMLMETGEIATSDNRLEIEEAA